jgi:hypothetical protein
VLARCGEGSRRCFPAKEEASGQGATDSRPAGLRGQAGPAERSRPSRERESEPTEGQGPGGWAENRRWVQFKK